MAYPLIGWESLPQTTASYILQNYASRHQDIGISILVYDANKTSLHVYKERQINSSGAEKSFANPALIPIRPSALYYFE